MENLKLTFRELLTIMIPGLYVILSSIPLISNMVGMNKLEYPIHELNVLLLLVGSFLVGIIIYAVDVPKKVWFFRKAMPTEIINTKIKTQETNIGLKKIHNAYFHFYDNNVSEAQKNKTGRLTSIYHFSMNIFVSSLALLIVYFIYWSIFNYQTNYWIPVLLIGITSIITTLGLFYGERKIKYYFERQYQAFIDSDSYKKLIE